MSPPPDGSGRRFARYVALGDSSAEGLDDPDGRGGFRGWANRLAEQLALAQGQLLYANLAVRGRRTAQIREDQLGRAVELAPDLVTLFSGTNDVVGRGFDADRVGYHVDAMHRALIGRGALLLTFTLPDLTPVMPLARLLRPRVLALNAVLREVSAASGAVLLDFARLPVTGDPRLWSADRLHANAAGHARIAAALAHALQLPGSDDSWASPLPQIPAPSVAARAGAEWRWVRGHFAPWAWRHLRGRSSGDGRVSKRPDLELVGPPVGDC